jgi:exodeoxyribonuclease I
MSASFFFYDLETSGVSAFGGRIMQFAGRRTDLNLNPIGEPVNEYIKLNEDILPDPEAIFITGITPQTANADGYTEAEFLKIFTEEIAVPDTIFCGFNTIRFDDEFMRCLHYRNFYDPYEWQWQDGRSKWDLLDVVRMTRALRPEGIEWPFDSTGKPTNRLELLTGLNKLEHSHAHDAMSDVDATIAVARMIRNKQTKLFDYLLNIRDKRKVSDIVESGQPFVYTSGKYAGEFEKTTVAFALTNHPKKQGMLVYDLRHDPLQYKDLSAEQLAEKWRWKKDATEPRLPVKTLQYNRCPAVAPLGVLDEASRARLKVDLATIKQNLAALKTMSDFEQKILKACDILDKQVQTTLISTDKDIDDCIYDGFFDNQDKQAMRVVRAATAEELIDLGLKFHDQRLTALLPLYKARNYPKALNSEERAEWEAHCRRKLLTGGPHSKMGQFYNRLQEISSRDNLTSHQQYLLEELRLYGESIMPASDEA